MDSNLKLIALPRGLRFPVCITKPLVRSGDAVKKGQHLYEITDASGKAVVMSAPITGHVVGEVVEAGAHFAMSVPVISIQPAEEPQKTQSGSATKSSAATAPDARASADSDKQQLDELEANFVYLLSEIEVIPEGMSLEEFREEMRKNLVGFFRQPEAFAALKVSDARLDNLWHKLTQANADKPAKPAGQKAQAGDKVKAATSESVRDALAENPELTEALAENLDYQYQAASPYKLLGMFVFAAFAYLLVRTYVVDPAQTIDHVFYGFELKNWVGFGQFTACAVLLSLFVVRVAGKRKRPWEEKYTTAFEVRVASFAITSLLLFGINFVPVSWLENSVAQVSSSLNGLALKDRVIAHSGVDGTTVDGTSEESVKREKAFIEEAESFNHELDEISQELDAFMAEEGVQTSSSVDPGSLFAHNVRSARGSLAADSEQKTLDTNSGPDSNDHRAPRYILVKPAPVDLSKPYTVDDVATPSLVVDLRSDTLVTRGPSFLSGNYVLQHPLHLIEFEQGRGVPNAGRMDRCPRYFTARMSMAFKQIDEGGLVEAIPETLFARFDCPKDHYFYVIGHRKGQRPKNSSGSYELSDRVLAEVQKKELNYNSGQPYAYEVFDEITHLDFLLFSSRHERKPIKIRSVDLSTGKVSARSLVDYPFFDAVSPSDSDGQKLIRLTPDNDGQTELPRYMRVISETLILSSKSIDPGLFVDVDQNREVDVQAEWGSWVSGNYIVRSGIRPLALDSGVGDAEAEPYIGGRLTRKLGEACVGSTWTPPEFKTLVKLESNGSTWTPLGSFKLKCTKKPYAIIARSETRAPRKYEGVVTLSKEVAYSWNLRAHYPTERKFEADKEYFYRYREPITHLDIVSYDIIPKKWPYNSKGIPVSVVSVDLRTQEIQSSPIEYATVTLPMSYGK